MLAIFRGTGSACVVLALLMFAWLAADATAQSDGAVYRAKVGAFLLNGRFDDAETLAKQWLAIAERRGDESLEVAEALEALTKVYAGLKRFDDAETAWRRCLELRLKRVGETHALIAQTLDVMASVYLEQGRKAEAQSLWREGLAAYRKQPPPAALTGKSNPPDLSHRAIAELIAQGRITEAEAVLRRSGDQTTLATFLLDRGRIAEAVTIHRQLLDSAPTADRALNVATLYRQRSLAVFEQEFLERAILIQEKILGPDHPNLIMTLDNLAASFEHKGDLAKAFVATKRASSIAGIARTRQTFSTPISVALQMRQPYLNFLRIASRLQREQPPPAMDLARETFEAGQLATETVLNVTLAQMGVRLSRGNGPLPQLIRSRQDLEREWQSLDRFLLAAITRPTSQAERDRLRAQMEIIDQKLKSVDAQLRTSFPKYYELAAPAPTSAADVQAMLAKNEAIVQLAITGEQAFVWVATRSDVRWRLLAQHPSDIELMVATLRCGLDYEGSWAPRAPTDAKSRCQKLLKQSYSEADITVPRPLPFDLATAHRLYAALLEPFEDLIAGKDLLLVPSGPLSSLPLHALVTRRPETGLPANWEGYARAAWFAKSFAATVLPSVSGLKSLRQQAGRSTAAKPYVAFANPILTGPAETDVRAAKRQSCEGEVKGPERAARAPVTRGIPSRFVRGDLALVDKVRELIPLVETADEVCAVARQLGASPNDILLGSNATERAVKSASTSGSLETFRVVHFATHGLLASEAEMEASGPAEPALVLTPPTIASHDDDGLLTSSEILQLKLNADWVVLSACNTAGGERAGADALSGLARAFFYAGSRALLVSHWAVDSAATVELITGAFRNLQADRESSRGRALQSAMLRMIGGGGEGAHPAYWAPFVVVGEGGAGR